MSEKYVVLACCLFSLIASVIEGYVDARKINKGRYIGHTLSAVGRVFVAVMFSYGLFYGWYHIASIIVVLLSIYWIFFDFSVNLFRGKDLFYVGKTATVDKIVRRVKFDGVNLLFFKVFLLVISLFTFYYAPL
jgi:hypothetical protein